MILKGTGFARKESVKCINVDIVVYWMSLSCR